jgi:hypothetical protein
LRYSRLTASELLTLAMHLNIIADYVDDMADRRERGESGNAYL